MGDFWTFEDIEGNQPALIVPGGVIVTYGSLSAMADAWTARLQEVAGGARPLVALEFTTTTDAIAAYLGVLRAGFPLLIVEPRKLGVDSQLIRVWSPDLNLTAGPGSEMLLAERPGWREDVASLPAPHPDLRVLLSTSGSTGEPKLVRLSGRNIAANADSIAEYLRLQPSDRAATTLPLFYSYGLSVLNSYLAVGAALVLIQESVTEPGFWENARIEGVTSLAFVPHQLDLLRGARFDGTQLPSLRYITQAGGKLDPDTVRHFWELGQSHGWQLFVMYGQTEAAPRISYVPPEALPGAAGTIGRAIPGGRLWLAAEDGSEIHDPGRSGELIYEGPNVMMGYATARADLAGEPVPDSLKTGDVAERTTDGYFRIVGRLKRFVKLYGLRLSLDQIEASLRSRGVAAHAIGIEDRLVILYQELVDEQEVREAVAEEHGLPQAEVHTDQLREVPLLPSGKIDHAALRDLAAGVLERSRDAQRVATGQASFAEVMRWATRHSEVRPSDSFVSLGGDSLSYLQVQIVLDERLGAAPAGWERMSIAELDILSREGGDGGPVARPRVSVGIDVILRLLAIGTIVVQHATTYPIFGGAWILLAVMGFSAARFQLQQIAAARPGRLLIRMLYPIIPLYYLILLAYALFRDEVPLSYWLLLGNYEPWTGGSLLVVYWFVSVYAQIVILLALVSAVAPLRRVVTADPWRAAVVATGGLLVGLVVLVVLQNSGEGLPYVPQRGLLECLSIFLTGWMLQRMQGIRQLIVTASMALGVLVALKMIDMTWQVLVFVLLSLVVLAFHRELRMPRGWARAVNQLASMTLYVYLVHEVVIFGLDRFDLPQFVGALLALSLSFAVSAGVKWGFDALDRTMVRRRSSRPADAVHDNAVF